MIQTEWSLHPQMFNLISSVWHKPMVDMFAIKINHKLPLYVSPVPDANSLNIDAFNIPYEGLDGYAFWNCSFHSKVIKNEHLQVQNNCSDPWLVQDALVLGSSESRNQNPITGTSLASSVETASQKYHQNLLYQHLHVWHQDNTKSHLNHSLSRWHRELRHLKDPHLEYCTRRGGPIFNCGANRIGWSTHRLLSQHAGFFIHLLIFKNLEPATIAGYRTAIAENLGLLARRWEKAWI